MRESENHYRSLFKNSVDGMLLAASDGTIFAANPAACRMLGRTQEELCAVGRDGVIDPADPKLQAALAERTRTGRFARELTLIRKDGTKFPAEVTTSEFKDRCGREWTSVIMRDITERKRAEDALRESEGRFRRITENMLDMIVQTDLQGICEYASPSFKTVLGYDPKYMLGRSLFELVHPNDLDKALETILKALATSSAATFEYRYKHADGHYVWLESVGNPLFDKTGQITGTVLATRDITERKRLEAELKKHSERLDELVKDRTRVLRESEEKYRMLVLTSPDAVAVTDLKGTITDVSDRTLGLLGFSGAEELLGKNSLDLIAPEDREKARILIQRTMNETVIRNAEYVLLRKDGTLIPTELNATIIKDGEGKPKAFIVSMRDTSERRRLEQMREQFLSHVTHELRTPLGPLKVHVEYALAGKLGPLSEKLKSSLQVMKMDTDRLMELTDQLLDVRRFQSGNFQLNLQPLDLREIINQSIKEAQVAIDVKKQHLHVEVPDGSLPFNGDAIRLSQVMTNLLSNASKFTPENGRITLKLEDITEAFKVAVSDTGIGIRKDDLSTVFWPFAAIQKPTWMKGAGLGLSIAKGIVETHGGKIWAESEGEGKGATFIFTLPKLTRVLSS